MSVIVALALCSHILTDLITVYGTAIFYPLSDWRPGLGITFVIDPWLTALLAVVLYGSLLRGDTLLPRVGLTLLVCALGAHTLLQRAAEHVGHDYAIARGIDPYAVRAIAQPLSPLHWKIIVSDAHVYRVAHVRLTDRAAFPAIWAEWLGFGTLLHAYRATDDADWHQYVLFDESLDDEMMRAVWLHPLLSRFRQFAALPAVYRIDRSATGLCVWFTDLRFTLPSLIPAFRYGLCRADRDGALAALPHPSFHGCRYRTGLSISASRTGPSRSNARRSDRRLGLRFRKRDCRPGIRALTVLASRNKSIGYRNSVG